MGDRPILFSAEMVRAILEGRKTQTRRKVKPQPPAEAESVCRQLYSEEAPEFDGAWTWWAGKPQKPITRPLFCRYGAPGDLLWVRETWGAVWPADDPVPLRQCEIEYRADLPPGCTDRPGEWPADEGSGPEVPKWRPSIHMPRWASRITLRIKDIRVERLQDISEDDARAEGVTPLDYAAHHVAAGCGARIAFEQLWNKINSPGAWEANPWVWVVSFERVKP
jgi:hypothetical protein